MKALIALLSLLVVIGASGLIAKLIVVCVTDLFPPLARIPIVYRTYLLLSTMGMTLGGIYAVINRLMARAGSRQDAQSWLLETVGRGLSSDHADRSSS